LSTGFSSTGWGSISGTADGSYGVAIDPAKTHRVLSPRLSVKPLGVDWSFAAVTYGWLQQSGWRGAGLGSGTRLNFVWVLFTDILNAYLLL